MESKVEEFSLLQFTEDGKREMVGAVAREYPLTIILNDEELVTLLCSPHHMNYLAVGFLASEGLIESKSEIKQVLVDEVRGVARVTTVPLQKSAFEQVFKRIISSGCGRGASFYSMADTPDKKVDSQIQIAAGDILALVNRFQHHSELYLATHAVHSAALCSGTDIIVFDEDIGRHNAIDKIFGKCLMEDIPTADRAIVTSGRITSEVLHKVAKRSIPIVVSISEPTNLGVKIAATLGITLVASARGKKINVYTHNWRITRNKKAA
ncbi:MAG: formate dehydrogenase family accessory protein FdhD [Chloroflexi bacterium RBG_16_50_9]|nr:MAG: formate dehydrogenase family accessory protein FdhD [Chloroflexi bacterium RBG_16_50_9]